MKGNKFCQIALVAVVLLSACQPEREKDLLRINEIQAILKADTTGHASIENTTELVDCYRRFAARYPADSLSPGYLFSAGRLYMSYPANRPADALETFRLLISEYPQHPLAADALFLKGFIYDANLQQYDQARECYDAFLSQYPQHDLADDAAGCLRFLGKSGEELIRELEEMNQ